MENLMKNRQKHISLSRTAANWQLCAYAAKLFVGIMPQIKETIP
ncbi:MAG: hypothetical protein WCE45_07160 [Sedimentisphaerales bacterium]